MHDDASRGATEVRLRSGAILTCGLDRTSKPWVALDGARLGLPPSDSGHGGIELVVSPDERYAAAFLYSGQSEQGYAILEVAPLRLVCASYYWPGEGDPPRFSPDGAWLAMLVATGGEVRALDTYFENVHDPDSDETVAVTWARLYVQRVPDGDVQATEICGHVPLSTDPDDIYAWETYGMLSWAGAATVRIGSLEIGLPAVGPIVVTPPGTRS